MPQASEPRAEATNGTNWLDTQNNTWGIYEYTGSEWTERDLWIVEDESSLDSAAPEIIPGQKVPLLVDSANGDFAMVVLYSKKVLYQRIADEWFVVGTPEWKTAKVAEGSSASLELKYNNFRPATGNIGDVLVLNTPDVITSISAAATWLLKTYNAGTGIWAETLVPIYSLSKVNTLTRVAGSVFLSYEDTRAVFEFLRYNENTDVWEALGEEASATEPTNTADDGTLWFNNQNLVVNVKVNQGGEWRPYRTVYPATDANGVILLGSAPTVQSTGAPLVENDLWVDTSDLENYPKMYRRTGGLWKVINVENNIDPIDGIAFGEAETTESLNYAEGMKLFDLAASTNDVKQYNASEGKWSNVSGFQTNGVPFFGRRAQRQMIVRSLAATISANEDIRAETVYFNLLAAPGYIELIDEMVTLNTDMKEVAFIVGDTPIRLKPTGAAITEFANNAGNGNTENGVSTFNPYVGMYYPWGLSTNVDGNEIMVPPSTIALRTLAYNDSISYPWMAPAGFTRGLVNNASSVGYLDDEGEFKAAILNPGQRDILYSNKINPIAFIPNRGLVVYGQKTRHSLETALDRINVARLVNYLRYNLDNISKPFLFEPNDFQTRDSVRTTFERFLADLVGLRGLYDFIVVCDETNNTPERIDRQELWVDIAIQPVQAIEFIYIPVRIVATGDDLGALFN